MDRPDFIAFPVTPGVYLYKDTGGRILYVGKARRLRQRIASYFRDENALSPKTRAMLRNAVSLDILTTNTEKEALLLEASLIKKHRPRYNIVLRDDKEYLLFRINPAHPYPRIEIVRRSQFKGKPLKGKIFGPFSSAGAARATWRLIHSQFPLRRCRDNAFRNRTRPCLYYDIGQCLGPCTLPVKEEDYQAVLRKVELLLEGRSRDLLDTLHTDMQHAAVNLAFETAARLRDQIRAIERTIEHQSVVLPRAVSLDLAGVCQTPTGMGLGIVFVRDGLLLDGRTFFWPGLTVEDTPELLSSFLAQFYLQGKAPIPPRVVVPWLADDQESLQAKAVLEIALAEARGGGVQISAPRGQDEDNLVLMAAANAAKAAAARSTPAIPLLLAERLHALAPVRRIEAVDISHTSGRQTKAGMVVFYDEEPVREDFRVYNMDEQLALAGHAGGDDFAALAAWATRRAAAGPPWADLVLVDGGKGQLNAVAQAFNNAGINNCFLLASIAKAKDAAGRPDRRAGNVGDRIFLPGRANPLPFKEGSPELLFLQRVRDAVHDFVLGKHQAARSAAAMEGELSRLEGVGPALARRLFERFGSLKAMAAADPKTLQEVPGIGRAKATLLHARLATLVT